MGKVSFIFLKTQLPENLGAAARVMMNFGIHEMRLVQPLCDPLDPKASAMAAGATQILDNAQIYEDLRQAVQDIHILTATTSQQRDIIKHYHTPQSFFEHSDPSTNRGIIFGPERTGLTNDEISHCHSITTIPVNEHFPSLNLAQATAIMSYEYFKKVNGPSPYFSMGKTTLAPQKEIFDMLNDIEERLDSIDYWRALGKKKIMWRNLKSLLTRFHLTTQDVKTLRGLFSYLNKK